jgi:FOG: EAL domain
MISTDPAELDAGAQQDCLNQYLEQLEHKKLGRRAAHIAFSRLPPLPNRLPQLRAAKERLNSLAAEGYGQLFSLPTADLLFFYEAADGRRVKAEIDRLIEQLVGDASTTGVDSATSFGRIYDVAREFEKIRTLVRCHICNSCIDKSLALVEENPIKLRLKERRSLKRPVPAHVLPKLGELLARVDIANFVRLRDVCRIAPANPPQRAFTDVSISASALSEALVPGFHLEADRSIARFLVRTLDRKILTMLLRRQLRVERSRVAIPISLRELKSNAFLHFDEQVSISYRGSIILKIYVSDLFNDLVESNFLLKLARHRGYKILLSGVTPSNISFVSLDGLAIDYVFCECTAASLSGSPQLEQFTAAVQRIAPAQLILAGIDAHEALIRAVDVGAELVQGSYVDKVLTNGQWPARFLLGR